MKWLSCLFLFSVLSFAQAPQRLIYVTSDPSGSCTNGEALQWNATSGNLSGCKSLTWVVVANSSGATGTVTSVTFAGTANEITATGTCSGTITITCTLSIPSAFQLPGTIDGLTITTTTGTFTLANAKTLTVNNTMTFTATDASTIAFGTGGTVVYTTGNVATATNLASYPTLCDGITQFSVGLSSGSNNCTALPAASSGALTQLGQATVGGTATGVCANTSAAVITCSSVPGTYSSLKITIHARSTASAELDEVYITANADGGSHYYNQIQWALNTTNDTPVNTNNSSPGGAYIGWISGASASSGYAGNISGEIIDYTSTAFNKQGNFIGGERDATAQSIVFNSWWMWAGNGSTVAITSLSFALDSTSNFLTGSVFTLYGVQ